MKQEEARIEAEKILFEIEKLVCPFFENGRNEVVKELAVLEIQNRIDLLNEIFDKLHFQNNGLANAVILMAKISDLQEIKQALETLTA